MCVYVFMVYGVVYLLRYNVVCLCGCGVVGVCSCGLWCCRVSDSYSLCRCWVSLAYLVVGRRLRRRLRAAALQAGRPAVGAPALHVLLALAEDRPVERVIVLVVHGAEQYTEQLKQHTNYSYHKINNR